MGSFDRYGTIDQHNFPQEVTAIEAHQGQKRKRDECEEDQDQIILRDEEELYFKDDQGTIIKCERAAMNAQVTALKKEFGDNIQQPFLRPKYNLVQSHLFPAGQKVSPQPYIGYDGNHKIIPRQSTCLYFMTHVDLMAADKNVPYDRCYR